MKVSKGKTVYDGGKKYQAGADLPDDVAARVGLEKKAPASGRKPKPAAGSGEAEKPSDR